jgi:tRNA 2-thiouridine synthesizing protein A
MAQTGDELIAGQPHADSVLEMLNTGEMQGATCALLTPAIKAKLNELTTGQVLEVRVDDPTAREDMAAWSRLTGHHILEMVEEGSILRCLIQKK